MEYRTNPKNDDQLSALGYGCMRFAGTSIVSSFSGFFDEKKVEQLVLSAIDQGINYFDTAYVYTGSEEALGRIMTRNHLRDKIFLATKLPIILSRGPEDLDKFFNKQLEHLQTDHIDYYLLHMLTDKKTWDNLCTWGIEDWVAEKKKNGQIINFGFSFHGAQDEFLALLDAYDWDFVQIQYNYSDENYQAGVTGCHYCMPCPAGVNIPACFSAYNACFSMGKGEGMLQYYMSTLMNDQPSYASMCKKCGKCEQHCPQHLPIRKDLEAVVKKFEGPLFKATKTVMPLFSRKKPAKDNRDK